MLQISQLEIAPGHAVWLKDVTWQQYKKVLADLGNHRSARIGYNDGRLNIMTPLSRHEDDKEIVSDLIKALMEELSLEFRALGSATFERQTDLKAIEPDQCFYIQHEKVIRGKHRIDLNIDPPPDLVLEIDAITRTHIKTYAAIGVPEIWQFSPSGLTIHQLQAGRYKSLEQSPLFPDLPLKEVIPYCLQQSRTLGRNTVVRDFRDWVRRAL